ncbi:MAG TPA: sugar transferase [Solirubrobacteraceae bacterium]|nr:sugar transferase [Solirubrobacteraceae bacterium]
MSGVTSIDAHRARSARTAEPDIDAVGFDLDDPVAAMDAHTQGLLGRRRAERRSWLVPRSLMLADLLGFSLAYLIVTLLWGEQGAFGSPRELAVFVLTLPCWIVVAKLHGLYRQDHERAAHATTDEVAGVFSIVAIGLWLLVIASHLTGRTGPAIDGLIVFWMLAVCLVPTLRRVAREACKRTRAYEQNTVIVGAGEVGQLVARKLVNHPEYGANVVGFVDRNPKARRADLPENLTILGPPERLPRIIESLDIERVVIAFSNDSVGELLAALRHLHDLPVQIDVVPRLFELVDLRGSVHWVEGMPLLGLPPTRPTRSSLTVKRAIDVLGAGLGLAVLAPLFAYVAVRIRLDSGGPVIFRQTRLGAHRKEFTALKFRTMKVDTDEAAHRNYIEQTMSTTAVSSSNGLYKLDRADAVTKFGHWLRRTSLDELPQLVNVLRGDMSLVGPRPCIPYEAENFGSHHLYRFSVPQGLTGLWQVTARANSTYGEALDMDVAYARGWSLGLDIRLLLRTPLQVLRQRSSTA